MKQVDFLLVYELWHRELYGIQLLGAELRRRGFSVEVRNTRFLNAADRALRPSELRAEVVVFPWVYSNADLKRALYMSGFTPKIVNLQSEQIHTAYTREARWTTVREDALNAHHVAWGPRSERTFEHWGVPASNIWSTGSIHLDLAHPKFDNCFFTKDDLATMYGMDADKRWLCFFSSFPATQATADQVNWWAAKLPGYLGNRQVQIDSRELVCEWLTRLAERNPEIEIVYRPHPNERLDGQLQNAASQMPNFHYVKDWSAMQWARASDHIAVWKSTAVTDAYRAGKPFSILRPKPVAPQYESELLAGASLATSFEALERAVRAGGADTPPIRSDQFAQFYGTLESGFAYARLADQLTGLLQARVTHRFDDLLSEGGFENLGWRSPDEPKDLRAVIEEERAMEEAAANMLSQSLERA